MVAGGTATVNLVALNPVDYDLDFDAPRTLQAGLAGEGAGAATPLTLWIAPQDDRGADSIRPRNFVSYTYELVVPAGATGPRILALRDPAFASAPVRALLNIAAPPPASAGVSQQATAAPLDSLPPPPAATKVKRSFLDNFSTYEPIYFLYGPDSPAAKFQFSFAYRMLDAEGYLARNFPVLRGMSFAYTQRSLWDITGDSSPFYDTSYIPEIFCASAPPAEKTKGGGLTWLGWQAGYGHESNGRDGPSSRSMNKLTARATVALGNLDGWRLLVTPRLWAYVADMSDNPDLNDYRGYMDLTASFGKNNNLNLAAYLRAGQGLKYGAMQLDLTYPLDIVFKNFAGCFLVQYWNGHGESLLNYNRRAKTLRVGISLVR